MKTWAAYAFSVVCISAVAAESDKLLTDPMFDDCEYNGRISFSELGDDLSVSYYFCEKEKRLLVVSEKQSPDRLFPSVMDKLFLPSARGRDDLKFIDECEDKTKPRRKHPRNFFFVVAHLPKNKASVNWKTGVKAAWTINRETLKFEKYPIRHIVCYEQTDP